tara:strand:- start:272 stop:1225 length:954 start_codon:yes stop_codon:yes gene_type:complete
MRILAVDDDPTILDMLRDCLTGAAGFDLECAEDAEEALDLLDTSTMPFDCFLLDIMLPGIDGVSLCAQLRKRKDHQMTPIIMITASRTHDLMQRAFHAGATDFIFKPLNGIELGARINTAGMLNDSLRREQVAHHSLSELTDLMKIKRDESFDLGVAGVDDLNGFENRLLRLPVGCYAMNLIAIKLPQIRNIFDTLTPAEFCGQMGRVAQASVNALRNHRVIMGYAGNGTIVAAIIARKRIDPVAIQRQIEKELTNAWLSSNAGQGIGADVSVLAVSEQRLWSGLSACNAIQDFLRKDAEPDEVAFDEVANLFTVEI